MAIIFLYLYSWCSFLEIFIVARSVLPPVIRFSMKIIFAAVVAANTYFRLFQNSHKYLLVKRRNHILFCAVLRIYFLAKYLIISISFLNINNTDLANHIFWSQYRSFSPNESLYFRYENRDCRNSLFVIFAFRALYVAFLISVKNI